MVSRRRLVSTVVVAAVAAALVNTLRNLVADWASWVAVPAPETALIT